MVRLRTATRTESTPRLSPLVPLAVKDVVRTVSRLAGDVTATTGAWVSACTGLSLTENLRKTLDRSTLPTPSTATASTAKLPSGSVMSIDHVVEATPGSASTGER